MKNLATCTPREFVRQTARIKKAVEKWLTDTDIENIRKRMPVKSKDMPEEEWAAALKRQGQKNVSEILDSIFEAHPDETVDLLALCCFVEPEKADEHTMSEYLQSLNELMTDEAVVGFFTSLGRLAQTNILRG